MRRAAAAGACLVVLGVLAAVFDRALLHFLGWDGQSSDNYAAWSGSVPALFTLAGMSTLIAGLFSHVNCHEPGCPRFGRHRVDGTPWCNAHHEKARPVVTDSARLDKIIGLLEDLIASQYDEAAVPASPPPHETGAKTALGPRRGM